MHSLNVRVKAVDLEGSFHDHYQSWLSMNSVSLCGEEQWPSTLATGRGHGAEVMNVGFGIKIPVSIMQGNDTRRYLAQCLAQNQCNC